MKTQLLLLSLTTLFISLFPADTHAQQRPGTTVAVVDIAVVMENNAKFKSLLDQNRKLSPKRQVINLENELINWQGKSEQIDDILVMRVRF